MPTAPRAGSFPQHVGAFPSQPVLSETSTYGRRASAEIVGCNVTLMGQVIRPTLKSDTENVVKKIEGVEHVDNQIEVLPPFPIDESLRRQLYRAIYGDP